MDVDRIRKDFPLYSSEDRDLIYLDSACQSLRPRQVMEAADEYYCQYPACGGRSVHRLATKVSVKIDDAREKIAAFIGCSDPSCIVFTKNCTEAINQVAKGYPFQKGDTVLSTDMEHNSNHVPWLQMVEEKGIRHRYVRTPPSGLFDIKAFREAITPDVKMVSMVHTNNVTGVTVPAEEIIKEAHDRKALVMLDGAQSAPHRPIDVEEMDVDAFTFSIHKMLGPSGVGVLYAKKELLDKLSPLAPGGGSVGLTDYDKVQYLPTPEKFEGGLLNYSGILGAAAAIDYLSSVGMEEISEHENRLNSIVTAGLKDHPSMSILEPVDPKFREGIFPFNLTGMSSHDVAMIIDEMAKVQIRSGMHCMHPFFLSRKIDGCARASFYLYNTVEECKRFIEAVELVASTFST